MVIIPPTGHLRSQVTISGSGDKFFKISDVRVGGVYTSGITGWEPTGLASGASGDPTGNAVYGGLDILVSGTSAEYEVVNKNTIQFTVPSINTLTGLQPKDQWAKYGYPAPITVISASRNVTGYASGISGEHFTAIPFINYLSPLSGLSGETAYVIGDGLLSAGGLTLMSTTGFTHDISGYWQEPTGVTGVGFTGDNVNNIFIYQSVTGIYANTTGDVTVYLPFEKINNTGISFTLPSGNFYGHVQILSSGNIKSKPSVQKIKPGIEITGYNWLPDDPRGIHVGFSGRAMTISGKYFLPELMHWTQGQFLNDTGTYNDHAGYLVEFGGEGATGLFLPKSGEELFALTGYTPATARTGPVKIKQNENINEELTGYYVSSNKYYIYPFAPQVSTANQGTAANNLKLWPHYLLETGNYDSGVYGVTGQFSCCSEQAFAVGISPTLYPQTGFLSSGITQIISGVTGYNTIFDSGFSGYVPEICVTTGAGTLITGTVAWMNRSSPPASSSLPLWEVGDTANCQYYTNGCYESRLIAEGCDPPMAPWSPEKVGYPAGVKVCWSCSDLPDTDSAYECVQTHSSSHDPCNPGEIDVYWSLIPDYDGCCVTGAYPGGSGIEYGMDASSPHYYDADQSGYTTGCWRVVDATLANQVGGNCDPRIPPIGCSVNGADGYHGGPTDYWYVSPNLCPSTVWEWLPYCRESSGIVTGFDCSGLVVRPSGYVQIPITGVISSGIITGVTYASGGGEASTLGGPLSVGVPLNTNGPESGPASMGMYNSSSNLGYRPTNFGVQNWYMSGVSGNEMAGIDPGPITVWYPTIGPNIQTCMEDYQAKKERGDSPIYFLSGCEQAFLFYYSGHWEYLDVNSPNFQYDLISCFLTSQVLASGLGGNTNFTGIDRSASSGKYDNNPCVQMAAIAAGHPGGKPPICPPPPTGTPPPWDPWPPTERPCDPYTQQCPPWGGGGGNDSTGPGGESPPPWESETNEQSTPTPPGFGTPVDSELTNRLGQVASETHMPGLWPYPPAQGPQVCATLPSAPTTSSNLGNYRVPSTLSPYRNNSGNRLRLRGSIPTNDATPWFFLAGSWTNAVIWENGAPRYGRTRTEVENSPLGYRRISLTPRVQLRPTTMQRQSPTPNPPLERPESQSFSARIQSPNPRGTSNTTSCGGSKPGTHSSWPQPGGSAEIETIDPAFPGTQESPGLQPPLPRNNQPETQNPGNTVDEGGVSRGGARNLGGTLFRPGETMTVPRVGSAGSAGIIQNPRFGGVVQIGNVRVTVPLAPSPFPTPTINTPPNSTGQATKRAPIQFPLCWPPESYQQQSPGNLGNPGMNPSSPPSISIVVPPIIAFGLPKMGPTSFPDQPGPWNTQPPVASPRPGGGSTSPPIFFPPGEQECGIPPYCIEGHPSFPEGCGGAPIPTYDGSQIEQGVSGWYILPDPEIISCSVNNCYGHVLYTGSTGYIAYDQNVASSGVVYEFSEVPHNIWNQQITLSAIFYGASGTAIQPSGAFYPTGVAQNFQVDNSGSIRFRGGYLQTEASSGLDLSKEASWSVEFWMNPAIDHTGLEHNPYYSKDIALFGFSGEYTGVSGNSFFHIGYTRESGAAGITNTVKPYINLSGIQLESKYLWTGWFPQSGYSHCAIVKDITGYSFHYNGCRYGEVIPTGLIDPHLPQGRTKFYFGGLCSGNFDIWTGYNQCFSPATTGSPDIPGRPIRTDLQLGLEDNFVDSGKYSQTITTGGFPIFVNDNPKCGSQSLLVTGIDYVQTTGSNFNYGTGDFTVECWIKPSGATQGLGVGGNGMQMLWALGQSNSNFATGNGLAFILNNYNNKFRLCFDYEQPNLAFDLIPPYNNVQFNQGEWNHIALCRENTDFFTYVNGEPAGALRTEDFAANHNTRSIYTGMPVIDAPGQQVFLGGGVSGHLSYLKIDDTGLLWESQPCKYIPRYTTASGLQPPGHELIREGQRPAGFSHNFMDTTSGGYEYTVQEGAAVECQATVVARWGGNQMHTTHQRQPVWPWIGQVSNITTHWIYNRQGSSGTTGTYENAQSFPIGFRMHGFWDGTWRTGRGGLRYRNYTPHTYKHGQLGTEADYGIPNFSHRIGETNRSVQNQPEGCFVEQILTSTITGVTKGDKINFYCPQWGDPIYGQPDIGKVAASIDKIRQGFGGEHMTPGWGNEVFIKQLLFKECPLVNYHGQIDQFIISSGAKYSSLPKTGTYDSGWLNSDLGERIYIDEINVTKRAIFNHDNGKYIKPSADPVSGIYTDAILDFETPSSPANIIADGITGDSQYARVFTTASVSSPANNIEFATGEGKFGTHAIRFPTGSTTYNRVNTLVTQNVTLGIEDFTAEMWIKPSGTAYSTTLTGVPIDNGIKRQTLLSFGTTGSGFNFFLSGGDGEQALGIDLFNGGRITGVTPDYSTGISGAFDPGIPAGRLYAFTTNSTQSSGSYFGYWNSGDWNHVAFTRQDRDMKAYVNGYFAGMINYTGIALDYGPSVYVSTGVAGVTLGGGLDIQSGPLTLGGGSLDAIGYEGLMDGFSLETGYAKYTGVFVAPRPFVSCNHRNELVCHADAPNNAHFFFDSHCCPTGESTVSWGDSISVEGLYFFDITGVLVGETRTPAADWFRSDQTSLHVTVPEESVSGPITIVGTGFAPVTGCSFEIKAPQMKIIRFTPISGYPNEVVSVYGQSLHLAQKLYVSGFSNNRALLPFTGVGTTGINFSIPSSGAPYTPIQLFSQTGMQMSTGLLNILSSGIQSFTPLTGVYGETVSFSGNNFEENIDIVMFPAYQGEDISSSSYVQTRYVSGMDITYIDNTGIEAKVPHELVRGKPIVSGWNDTTEIVKAPMEFTPMPTISGIETVETQVGCQFRITGINASYLVPLLGFTGNSLQPYTAGDGVIEFVANTGDSHAMRNDSYPPITEIGIDRHSSGNYSKYFYFGKFELDKTHIDASAGYVTGYTVITGTFNDQLVGTGNPFLISRHEIFNNELGYTFDSYNGVSGVDIDLLRQDFTQLRETYALQNVSKITGDQTTISGRIPVMIGITPTRGDGGVQLHISGRNALNVTGIKFIADSDASAECHMDSGIFIPQTTEISSSGPDAMRQTTQTITGWHFNSVYTGDGEYIDVGNQVQLFKIYPCEELRIYGSVSIELMYDPDICITGAC